MAKKEKARMGRPPLKPKERRNSIVTLRLKGTEREELQKDADGEELSISMFLMKCWKQYRGDK